jgi:hypothetical protein
VLTGHCNRCGKIWTLETRQGVCQWCGQLAVCQSSTAKPRHIKSSPKRNRRQAQTHDNGYSQLDGEWLTYYKVAKTYESRVPGQDRDDIRHDIMIELDRATKRDGKPLPLLRAYRIASLTVALYWRELAKHQVKVCIYSGLPVEPHCARCSHNGQRPCPYLAFRPVKSLDDDTTDSEGNTVRLKDTVADDHAIDLDAWLDARTWLLGCPMRLVQIANKRLEGIPLTGKDQDYLDHWRKKNEQLKLAVF